MNSIEQQPSRSDEYRTAGYWGDDTFVTLIDKWADADPSHPYVSDGTRELSYGEFRDQANRLATAFATLGVRHGDRVAVQLPNWSEYFLVYAACSRLGAVMIPIVVVYRAGESASSSRTQARSASLPAASSAASTTPRWPAR